MRQDFSIPALCEFFEVSRSGYYAWQRQQQSGPCPRERLNQQLLAQIRRVYQASHGNYGSPRTTQALRKEGYACGRNRVARLMRQDGLRGKQHKRFRPRTTDSKHHNPVAPNLLKENTAVAAPAQPNQTWVADITYIPMVGGWLYLAAIMDLCSRKIVGWHLANHLKTDLVLGALQAALWRQNPAPGLLVHHSDRGCQYTSQQYAQQLAQAGLVPSMSSSGNCYDNAAMEAFWSTLKREWVDQPYTSEAQARLHLFEFIEVEYNRKRLHSPLGYCSPQEYENAKLKEEFERKERGQSQPFPSFIFCPTKL
jgi:putative transposase